MIVHFCCELCLNINLNDKNGKSLKNYTKFKLNRCDKNLNSQINIIKKKSSRENLGTDGGLKIRGAKLVSLQVCRKSFLFFLDEVKKLAKCLEEVSFVGFLICTLCVHNLPAQRAATEITFTSLRTPREEIT